MQRNVKSVSLALTLLAVLCLAIPATAQSAMPFWGFHVDSPGEVLVDNDSFLIGTLTQEGEHTYFGELTGEGIVIIDKRDSSFMCLFTQTNSNGSIIGMITGAGTGMPLIPFDQQPPGRGVIEYLGGTGQFAGTTGHGTWISVAALGTFWYRGIMLPGNDGGG